MVARSKLSKIFGLWVTNNGATVVIEAKRCFLFFFCPARLPPKEIIFAPPSRQAALSLCFERIFRTGIVDVFLWRTLVERFPESARCVHYFSNTGGG